MAQTVKNPPAMWETWVRSLGWEDPLEEGKATHSSILAWRIPMDRGLAGYSPGIFRVGQDRATKHSTAIKRSQWMNSQAAVVNLTMSALTFNRCHWQVPLWSAMNKYILQIRSVAQSCPTLCNPMNRSTPGLPIHHQLPEFTQTHVHRVSDAIQSSHPLSSPSPPAPNPSQHQSLFQWVNSSHDVAKVLVFQL